MADFFTVSIAWVAVSRADADGTTTVFVFRTTDGGQTWRDTIIQQTSPIYQITFVDSQHGWMLSKQVDLASAEAVAILRTTDGGKTWTIVSSALPASTDTPPPGQLPFGGDKAGIGFLDALTGWVTGNFPLNGYVFLYMTHDGGVTWNRQTFPFSPDKASTLISSRPPTFFTATEGILPVSFVTEAASILDFYVTHDDGATWQSTTPLAASAAIADFIDMEHGWASGGQQWAKLARSGDFQHITRLDFVASSIGWAIGATVSHVPSLLKTLGGGKTWTVIPYTIL